MNATWQPSGAVHAAPLSIRRRRLAQATWWIVLVALACIFRAGAIRSDLPYIGYVDEGHVLHQVVNLLQGRTLDTGFYNYPSLPSYMIAGAVLAYAPLHQVLHGRSFWEDFQNGGEFQHNVERFYDFLVPPAFILCARAIVVLLSVGTVILAGVLATRLGGLRTGLLALLFTALCPALVSRGAIVIVDAISTFFALATLLLCQRLQTHSGAAAAWRYAAFGGLAAGFAFTSKYTVGAVFLAVLMTIALLRVPAKTKALLVALAGAGLIAGSILTMPILITRFAKVVETVRGIASFYDSLPSDSGYAAAAISREEIGLPLVAAGLAGVGLMLFRRGSSRPTALSWLAFAALMTGVLIRSKFQPFRNLLPLVPLVCIGAAYLIARVPVLRAAPRFGRFGVIRIGSALTLMVAVSLAFPAWENLRQRTSHVDSRVAAIDWLRHNTHAEDRILALEELAILPAEWSRLSAKPILVSWSAALGVLHKERFDYVVASAFELRFARDQPGPAKYAERWAGAVSSLQTQATFGHMPNLVIPGVWRSNDQRIVIMRGGAEQAVPQP